MTPDEVQIVLRRRDDQLTFKPQLTADDEAFRAAHVAKYLKGASLQWALAHVMEQAMRGKAPTDAELIAAWREHQTALPPDVAELVNAPAPQPPREVAIDTDRSRRWNRARVRALVDGASADEAVEAANEAVGATPDPVVRVDVAGTVAELRAKVARLEKLRMPRADTDEGVAS